MSETRYSDMSDEEMLRFLSEDSPDDDGRKIRHALARIVVAMKKKGIDCGGFVWWGEESFGLTHSDDYKHLGRIHDYAIRYSNEVINSSEE